MSISSQFIFFLWKLFSKSCWTPLEQVKNDHFERGCRWFQLFFHWFSVILFSKQNHPWFLDLLKDKSASLVILIYLKYRSNVINMYHFHNIPETWESFKSILILRLIILMCYIYHDLYDRWLILFPGKVNVIFYSLSFGCFNFLSLFNQCNCLLLKY